MARGRKKVTDPKNELVEAIFGKGVSVEFAERMLVQNWFENLEKYFKPAEVEEPVETTKLKEYKKMYKKLSNQVKNLNEVITKFETTGE